MQITGLDHYNIAAPAALLEQVSTFYCEILGLRRGYRPAFKSEGIWLYAGTQALVHLKVVSPEAEVSTRGTGWFAHIAFRCAGLDTFRARLHAHGVPYEIDIREDPKQIQLFLTDPAGVKVELNFAGDEST